MLRVAVLLCLRIALLAAEDATCVAGGGPGCSPAPAPPPFCAQKGCNLNHSGLSSFLGPFPLPAPAWTFQEPRRSEKGSGASKVFLTSAVLDGELNSYLSSTTGWIYSVDKAGRLRWEFGTGSLNAGGVALLDGAVYAVSESGMAFALDAGTGRERWRSRFAVGAPSDAHSLVAHGDTVLTACNLLVHGPDRPSNQMGEAVCALSTADGSLKWSFDMVNHTGRLDALSYNQVQAIVNDTAVFGNSFGGLFRVSMRDGSPIWHSPAVTSHAQIQDTGGMLPHGTTATMVVGHDDRVYHGINGAARFGCLRVHNIRNGALLWQRDFGDEINAAPAVGPVLGHNRPAVVVALGNNPSPFPRSPWERFLFHVGLLPTPKAYIEAFDAGNGNRLWRFMAPAYDGTVAGSTISQDSAGELCFASAWGSPSIGADGTVYVSWSGGYTFALRDLDGDGTVDPRDPSEVSSYRHGHGSGSQSAIGPGLLLATTCREMLAFAG